MARKEHGNVTKQNPNRQTRSGCGFLRVLLAPASEHSSVFRSPCRRTDSGSRPSVSTTGSICCRHITCFAGRLLVVCWSSASRLLVVLCFLLFCLARHARYMAYGVFVFVMFGHLSLYCTLFALFDYTICTVLVH